MNKSGHTLIEMMMVVAIMGVTAATTLPSFVESMPLHRMKQAAWQVYIDLEQAKARAVSENHQVELKVNNSLDQYSLWVDENRNGQRDAGETTVKSIQDIKGIDLYAYPDTASFSPTGTLDTSYYYFYIRLYSQQVGYKYVYVFPNGHIDPMRIQGT